MSNLDDAYCETVVLILKSVFANDAVAKAIFESADWREGIRAHAVKIEKKLAEKLSSAAGSPTDSTSKADVYSEPIHMVLAGHSGARFALKDIKGWLKGATQVSICDPYIMHGPRSGLYRSDEDYVAYIVDLIPDSARLVKFYGQGFTTDIKKSVISTLKQGRKVDFFDTPEIHDRYILKDLSECRILGTSFGGLGNKIFTVLDLPEEDVKILKTYLRQIERQESLPD